MKVTKVPVEPPKPDIVITLSWEEAERLKRRLNGHSSDYRIIDELRIALTDNL